MSVGKRASAGDPLTEHDIADRLDKAALRLLRIMYDLRVNHPELVAPVRTSRYWTNAVSALAHELGLPEWDIDPKPLHDTGPRPAAEPAIDPDGACIRTCGRVAGCFPDPCRIDHPGLYT